jgi:Arc/MetJ-type ribon-helix-helix transcriptional regulator
MDTTEKTSLKTIRFSPIEARLLEQSAAERNMSVSDVVRQAVIAWREKTGDRQQALEVWTTDLLAKHGAGAQLTARVNDQLSLDIEIDGTEMDDFIGQAVFDVHDQVQLWVGDPETDARVYLGRVRVIAGAAITVPVVSLPALGASDADAV